MSGQICHNGTVGVSPCSMRNREKNRNRIGQGFKSNRQFGTRGRGVEKQNREKESGAVAKCDSLVSSVLSSTGPTGAQRGPVRYCMAKGPPAANHHPHHSTRLLAGWLARFKRTSRKGTLSTELAALASWMRWRIEREAHTAAQQSSLTGTRLRRRKEKDKK